jgi:O-antigen/teichoic acid export membrane protein
MHRVQDGFMENQPTDETPSPAKGNEIAPRPSHTESGLWIFTSSVFSGPIRLLMHVLLARLLQPVAFGLLGLANSTAVSLCGLSTMGLDVAANRYSAENYRRDASRGRYYAILIYISTLCISAVFFVAASWLIPYWDHRVFPISTRSSTVSFCLLLGWTNAIATYGINLVSGLQLFRVIATSTILQNVVTLVAAFAGGAIWGINGAIAGYWLASVVCIIYFVRELRKFDPELFRWQGALHFQDFLQIMRFALPVWLGGLAIGPVMTLSMSLLSRQVGGPHALGVFNTANPLRMIVGLLPGIVGTVMGPAIMEEGGRLGRPAIYEKLLRDSLIATSFLILPVLSLLIGFRPWIFMVYGHAYAGSSDIFVPLVFSVALTFIVSPTQFAMLAKNKIWPLQFLGIMDSLLLLLLAYWWVPGSLGQGLAWAVLSAELTTAVGMQEYCIWAGVTPRSLRPIFYSYVGVLAAMLLFARQLSPLAQAVLSLPVSLGLAVWIIRRHPSTESWLVNASPAALKSIVRRVLDLGTRGLPS